MATIYQFKDLEQPKYICSLDASEAREYNGQHYMNFLIMPTEEHSKIGAIYTKPRTVEETHYILENLINGDSMTLHEKLYDIIIGIDCETKNFTARVLHKKTI